MEYVVLYIIIILFILLLSFLLKLNFIVILTSFIVCRVSLYICDKFIGKKWK